MFKALCHRQLLETVAFFTCSRKTGKRRNLLEMLLFAALMLGVFGCVVLGFDLFAYMLGSMLLPCGFGWLYFAFMGTMALLASTLASAFISHSRLFTAKDNELLLSLPIPPLAILFSRLLGVYFTSVIYLLLVFVPTEVVYLAYTPAPVRAFVCAVIMLLLLAGVSTVLSGIIGWAAAVVQAHARHKSITVVIVSLALFAAYYAGLLHVEGVLNWVLNNLTSGAELIRARAGLLYFAGSAAAGDYKALAMVAVAVAALCAAFCWLLSRFYVRLVQLASAKTKISYTEKRTAMAPVKLALLRREFLRLISSPAYMLNGSIGTLAFAIMGVAALCKASQLRQLFSEMPQAMAAPMLLMGLCSTASLNLLTAPSVSLEGRTLWQLQSLPLTPQQVLVSKLEFHMLLTAVPMFFCCACMFFAVQLPLLQCLLVLAAAFVFVLFTASLGLCLGICLPNLNWTSEAAVIKQSASTFFTLVGGWAAVLAMFGAYQLVGEKVASWLFLSGCAAVLAAVDFLLLHWLGNSGTKRFAEL